METQQDNTRATLPAASHLGSQLQTFRRSATAKITYVLATTLFCHAALAADSGYVILGAIQEPHSLPQPACIALVKGNVVHHVPADAGIFALPPGRYRVHHFDIHRGKRTSKRHVEGPTQRFTVTANVTTLVGLIHFDERPPFEGWSPRANLLGVQAASEPLLRRACRQLPKAFEAFPVRAQLTDGSIIETKLDCSSFGASTQPTDDMMRSEDLDAAERSCPPIMHFDGSWISPMSQAPAPHRENPGAVVAFGEASFCADQQAEA